MECFAENIETVLQKFSPISLGEMDAVKLQNRTDTKYVLPLSKLPAVLESIANSYQLLFINDEAPQPYTTVYFDTPTCEMYIAHQNGKLNRFKVRHRVYETTRTSFFEVKHKNNKGVTAKKRIPFNLDVQKLDEANEFLKKYCPYGSYDIVPKSVVKYTRLTFASLVTGERVTVDYDLRVHDANNENVESNLNHISIIEVKRDKSSGESIIIKTLLLHRIFKSGMSKYCIGMASINENLKRNLFKTKLRTINKLKDAG